MPTPVPTVPVVPTVPTAAAPHSTPMSSAGATILPPSTTLSAAELFRELPEDIKRQRLTTLTDDECSQLYYDWDFWARPKQREPLGPWTYWLLRAGRGFGKTRVGAEMVRKWARRYRYVNLIGATADDARDIMIEGESGIMAICTPDERPLYKKSDRKLVWPSGAVSLIFTADEPERLRGKQHEKAWADEVAAWRRPEAWDQLQLGLRLGDNPQCVITTTPKPTKLIRDIRALAGCVETIGSTYENRANLSAVFYGTIITKYEGTRLGRQELNAEILEDNPNALWKQSEIDADRITLAAMPALARIVGGIDPAVTSSDDSDETGIVFVGRDRSSPPHFYVIDDRSLIAYPDAWARAAIVGYSAHRADRLVGETNNGGDMVEATLRHVNPDVSYKSVHASRGKEIRAEPIAALYEQHRVHHVGVFGSLEDQMCNWNPADSTITVNGQRRRKSPDRMDALVWAITDLTEGGHGLLELWGQQAADTRARMQSEPQSVSAMSAEERQMQPQEHKDEAFGLARVAAPKSLGRVMTAPQTPKCPECGNVHLSRFAVGKSEEAWRCNGCGASGHDTTARATLRK